MSEEQLKAFLEKVQGDTSLQEKLKAAVDTNAVSAIAKEAGFSISGAEIQSIQSRVVNLSDKELEDAVGGIMNPAAPFGTPQSPAINEWKNLFEGFNNQYGK
jgi:predicted ribosomally synthesized peptide with nif11-like leader